jgi:uncharacterized protein (UPF0261 family)
MKTVALVGALDTKSKDYAFAKTLIEAEGIKTLVIDYGIMKEPDLKPDIDHHKVAMMGDGSIENLQKGDKKDEAMKVMRKGLSVVVKQLYDEGKIHGVFAMGGSGGTVIATAAMQALPIGVPKVMVSTVAGGDVAPYVGIRDIIMFPSIVDVAGINRISRTIYRNAIGSMIGMMKLGDANGTNDKPLIAASMFGNTTDCVGRAQELLLGKGFETLVFHAVGTGGRTMEDLIEDGYFEGLLDITTTELADEVCGGVLSAGPERGTAGPRNGIPTVIVPGCVDMANFGGVETVPEKYKKRNLYEWNANVTLMRTDETENRKIGKMIADAANRATGPIAVLLPLKGVSMLDSEGQRFWEPKFDKACFDAIKANLRDDIPVVEIDQNINNPQFADKSVELLLDMIN